MRLLLLAALLLLETRDVLAQPVSPSIAIGSSHRPAGFSARATLTTSDTTPSRLGLEVGMTGDAIVQLAFRSLGSQMPGGMRKHQEIFFEGPHLEHRPFRGGPIEISASAGAYQIANHDGAEVCRDFDGPLPCVGPEKLIVRWDHGFGGSIGLSTRIPVRRAALRLETRYHWVAAYPAQRFLLVDLGLVGR